MVPSTIASQFDDLFAEFAGPPAKRQKASNPCRVECAPSPRAPAKRGNKSAKGGVVKNPCRKCRQHGGSQPDEQGRPRKLCSSCARDAGTYIVLYPCRNCPGPTPSTAHHPDEQGNPNRLCAPCAREAGTHTMRDPCRDCKLWTAGYPDERGRPNRLCTMCAQKAGTHVIKRPCRGCSKTTAHIMDATGKPNQFCAECAEARGLDKTRKRTKKRRCPDKREVCSVATALLTMASECEM